MPSDFQLTWGVLLLRFVAGAGQDGESRILGKSRIGGGEFTKGKNRAACGLDAAGVKTIRAETRRAALFRRVLLLTHEGRISQHAALTDAEESPANFDRDTALV